MEQVFTKENFEQQVLGAKQPVLVDFWAPWCGPCRMLGPVVQRVAGDAQGRWQVGKVNVDEQPELARRFGIMSIPTVMVFKNGRPARAGCGRTDTAKAGRDAAKRAVTPWPCGRAAGRAKCFAAAGAGGRKGENE